MKRTESKKIRKAAEEWSRTFDTISDLIFILDEDFRFVKVNKAVCDFLKKGPKDLIGKRCYEIVHCTDKPWPTCPYKKTLKIKKSAIGEILDPNLGLSLLITTSPIFDDKGKLIGCVHVAKDITKRKKAEEKLKKLNQELQSKIDELERFTKLAVGRELKMIELKKRIKKLEGKLKSKN